MDKMKQLYFPVTKGETVGNIASATITTNDLDRQGEIVEPDGLSLTNYLANPIVLYGHAYGGVDSIPVGRAVSMEVIHSGDKKSLKADWEWQGDDVTPLISAVKKSWERGFLNTVSIGFMVNEYDKNAITKSELMEFSIVPVPANPQALRLNGFTDAEVKALGVEPTPVDLIADLERMLDKSVVPYQDLLLAPEDLAWDSGSASAAVAKWAGGPGKDTIDWRKYRKAFCWFDGASEDTFGAYKLGIGDIVGGELRAVPRGIFAAAGVLMGARGGVDIPETDKATIKAHLTRYYAKMQKVAPWNKGLDEAALKEGRVLSSKNYNLVKDCIDSLQALLDVADTSVSGDTQPEPDDWLTALHKQLINKT